MMGSQFRFGSKDTRWPTEELVNMDGRERPPERRETFDTILVRSPFQKKDSKDSKDFF